VNERRTTSPSSRPDRPRRLVVLAGFYALMGFVPASWLVRVPDIKEQAGVSTSLLGVAFFWGAVVGLGSLVVAGHLCGRFGSAAVLVTSCAGLWRDD
jgi:hypothetical protein